MEFNKEEISLCKQVTEKHRKPIKYGDWYWSKSHNKPLIAIAGGFKANDQKHFGVFKIWTISDSLEFLRERCKDHVLLIHEEGLDDDDEEWYLWFDEYKETQQWDKGKTPLEACLKVVLAVLEEE